MIPDCFYLKKKKENTNLFQCKKCYSFYQTISNHYCPNCHNGHAEQSDYDYPLSQIELEHNLSNDCSEEKFNQYFDTVERICTTYLCEGCHYLWVAEIESNKKELEGINYLCCPNCGNYIKKYKTQLENKTRTNLTKSIRHEVLVRDNYCCCECGATKDKTTLHIDHILPVSKGGTDELSNLRVLCEACNLSKSNRIYGVRK